MSVGPATRQLRKARKLLSDAQLIAVFRNAQTGSNPPIAIKIICNALDKGMSLDAFAREFDHPPHPGRLNMSLNVSACGLDQYKIELGFAGGHAGDGGEWIVTFDSNGDLTRSEGGLSWIC